MVVLAPSGRLGGIIVAAVIMVDVFLMSDAVVLVLLSVVTFLVAVTP